MLTSLILIRGDFKIMSANLTVYFVVENIQQKQIYLSQPDVHEDQDLPVTPRVSEAFGKWIPIYLQASNLQS